MWYNRCFETDVTLLFSEILLYGLLQADMTVKCFAFMDTMDALASLSRAGLYERTEGPRPPLSPSCGFAAWSKAKGYLRF